MYVLLGSCVPVHVVSSGVYLYLACSLGFATVVFSGVYLYLSCSLGFVTVVLSGVHAYLLSQILAEL